MFNFGQDFLPFLFLLNDSLLEISGFSGIICPLIFKSFLKFQVFLSKHHDLFFCLSHNFLLLFLLQTPLILFSLCFQGSLCIKKFILGLQVLSLSFWVISKQNSCIIIFIVNLLEVSILSTSLLSLLNRVFNFEKLSLMTYQKSIFSQVEICIIMIGLSLLCSSRLTQILHLLHLLGSETNKVNIVRIGIWNCFNRSSIFFRSGWPSSLFPWILDTLIFGQFKTIEWLA